MLGFNLSIRVKDFDVSIQLLPHVNSASFVIYFNNGVINRTSNKLIITRDDIFSVGLIHVEQVLVFRFLNGLS